MARKVNVNTVLVTGASGLVGSSVVRDFERDGWNVLRLTRGRHKPSDNDIPWDPLSGQLITDPRLEGLKAVVHLAGENILGRWTPEKKKAIRASRVEGTALLVRSLAQLQKPPPVLLSASAVGIYGDTARREATESCPPGDGFLAEVCQAWEQATDPAAEAGIRVLHLRIGVVLDRAGGALRQMLTPFRLGLGGPIGNGQQFVSWITLDDLVRAVRFLIEASRVRGPVNLVSPSPITNRSFARALGQALHRPALIPLPTFVIVILFGEMAEETLLASCRAVPSVLLKAGFSFQHDRLDAALRHALSSREKGLIE